MKTKFIPIAMRCNKEQFEAIKPKLEEESIKSITSFEICGYLTNNWCGNKMHIANVVKRFVYEYGKEYQKEIYETWNEATFLRACGIEVKPSLEEVKSYFKNAKEVRCLLDNKVYDISKFKKITDEDIIGYCTDKKSVQVKLWYDGKYAEIISYKDEPLTVSKEFILDLHKEPTREKIEKAFPSVFVKDDLEVGKWYRGSADFDSLIFITELKNQRYYNKITYYGFSFNKWNNLTYIANLAHEKSLVPATHQEVETALINDAKKRGLKKGVVATSLVDGRHVNLCNNAFMFNSDSNLLYVGGCLIFDNGKWATIIEQPTEMTVRKLSKN